jgi:bacteriocin biosynthesis cyclodehydratase domain-containing protein
MLLPALRRLWRDERTLQLGVDPERAVVIDAAGGVGAVLDRLDGRSSVAEVVRAAATDGVAPDRSRALIDALASCGAVVDAPRGPSVPRTVPVSARPRLAQEAEAISLRRRAEAAAGAVLTRRAGATVVVYSRERAGPVVAALLAASGVGHVQVVSPGVVGSGDTAVGGILPHDEYRSRSGSAADAVRRAAPEAEVRTLAPGQSPDLVVLAGPLGPSVVDSLAFAVRELAHLAVRFRDGVGIVGPLVVPGVTGCLHCMDLHRVDRDPAWPALAAQLATARPTMPEPASSALVTFTAALTAMQALEHLDGALPESANGTLELAEPGTEVRRRTWPPHPACGCLARASPPGTARRPTPGQRRPASGPPQPASAQRQSAPRQRRPDRPRSA